MRKDKYMNDMHILLHNIAWLRNHHGMSKKEMAALLGISTHSLSKIEKGIIPPRLRASVLIRIYKRFGILSQTMFKQPFNK